MGKSAPKLNPVALNPVKLLSFASKKPLAAAGMGADPFGIDPIGSKIHGAASKIVDPQDPEGKSINQLVTEGAALDKVPEPGMEGSEPDLNKVTNQSIMGQVRQLGSKRASKSLFSGGGGFGQRATAFARLFGS